MYSIAMLLYVWRLREMGTRVALAQAASHGVHGRLDLRQQRVPAASVARLYGVGTKELVPALMWVRVLKISGAMHLAGFELIGRGTKSKPEKYPQSWLCSVSLDAGHAIMRTGPHALSATGFHPEDDNSDA